MTACAICQATMERLFDGRVLGRYDIGYFHCRQCGYVCTEQPYWLAEAYSSAIADADTGILQRNWSLASKLAGLLYFCLQPRATFLDVAGGYGILTRWMRDLGFDYYWDDKYCENLVARGFEAEKATRPFSALSGFEVIEHAENPLQFVTELMERHRCRTFIFSTVTYPGPQPPSPQWWYYSPHTGQHISFFHQRTLEWLARRLGLAFYSRGGVHMFTDQRLRHGWLLPLLTSPAAIGIAQLVRMRMGSRAWADHELLSADPGAR